MKRLFHIGLLLLLALPACHSPHREAEPCLQEELLYQLEFHFANHPDSVLQILDTLNIAKFSEKEQAHYCLLKVKVRDALFLYGTVTDSLLQIAENCFIGGKDKWFEAQTCEALSRLAFKEGKGEQIKLDWLLKALQSMEHCRHVDERLIRYANIDKTEQERIDDYTNKIRMRVGMCYLDNGYTKEALDYLKPVYQYYADNQNQGWEAISANMLGNAYLANKEYDSCRLFFEKGLKAAQKFNQTENIMYYHFSMSMLYLYQFDNLDNEDQEEGCQLLRKAIEDCHHGLSLYDESMYKYKDGFYCNLGKCYYRLEQYDSCVYYVEKQLDFMNAMHYEIVPNIENAALFYRLYMSYEAMGNQEKALEYANRYIEMRQAIEDQPKAVEQVKNEYDKNLEMMRLQNEQQVKRYRLYLLLALVLVVLVVVLWFSNRYRKNKEIEALRFKEAYRLLQAELEQAAQHSQQLLQQRVMNLYTDKGDRTWERILVEFETAYPQATEKLQAAYPSLTESERNIVILSFLGFRTKEEAEILNLSLNTVEKYRTNIRKKAGSAPIIHLIR